MPSPISSAFEIENARNMSRSEVVGTFVPTDNFYSLLNAKHHVVIGSRGSGKTAIAKMLSHDYLVGLAQRGDERAAEVVETGSLIGLYISTRTEWVGSLKNKPWQSDDEQESRFQWRLNVASCIAFLEAAGSCLATYVSDDLTRLQLERSIVDDLREAWLPDANLLGPSLAALQRAISDADYSDQVAVMSARVHGGESPAREGAFDTELFLPLRRGIELLLRRLDQLKSATWAVCIDEAEVLDEVQQRVLNSHIRADSERLVFKITTLPYRHLSLDTNAGAPIRVGHDFDYVYIDKRRTDVKPGEFAERLFERVVAARTPEHEGATLETVLGSSELLSPKSSDWDPMGDELDLLRRHGTEALVLRAERLIVEDPSLFKDSVARKVHGLLLLRERVRAEAGNTAIDYYSGAEMLVRCGDDNPRRVIRLLKALLSELELVTPIVPSATQSRRFISFSADALERTKSEPGCGHELHKFLRTIGSFMKSYLHDRDLSGDVVTAVKIDPDIDDDTWTLVERAVEWGLLMPTTNTNSPNQLPVREGVFHLAYVLSPWFRLFPRRGRSIRLSTVLKWEAGVSRSSRSPDLFDQNSN